MTTDLPTVDGEAIRAVTCPGSKWAVACGDRVERRRAALGFSRSQVARSADTSEMTVFRIERGDLVPRDYLRLAVAVALFCEVDDLWPALSRRQLTELLEAS